MAENATYQETSPLGDQQKLDIALLTIQQMQSHPEMLEEFQGFPPSGDHVKIDYFKKWTKACHLPSELVALRNATFAKADIERYLSNPRSLELLEDTQGENVTLEKILEVIKLPQYEEATLKELGLVMQEARQILEKYAEFLPDLVPQKPTMLILHTEYMQLADSNNSEKSLHPHQILQANYSGEFMGIHYIEIDRFFENSPLDAYKGFAETLQTNSSFRKDYIMAMIHELIHQRHAELIGQDEFQYPSPSFDTIGSGIELRKFSRMKTLEKLQERLDAYWSSIPEQERNWWLINKSFIEGATVSAEIFFAVAESWNSNDPKDKKWYSDFAKARAEEYPSSIIEAWIKLPTFQEGEEEYATGLTIIRRMFEKSPLSIKDIVEFYKNIDLRKLYDAHISKGSPQWKAIMQDPWNELLLIARRDILTTTSPSHEAA